MLKVAPFSLFGGRRDHLSNKQGEINRKATYAEKVEAADELWKAKSGAIFTDLREILEHLCPGIRRCHYCEDSAADEIEHIYPKSLFPERTFVWDNYLFACGPCNGSNKRDQFAVFDADLNVVEISRKRSDPIMPPATGPIVFIDPRKENPLSFIELDLNTGLFVPSAASDSKEYKRAEYTIRILGLNTRDYLSRSRRTAYRVFIKAIDDYILIKKSHPPEESARARTHIKHLPHQSVFEEIGRVARDGIEHTAYWIEASELWEN